MIRMITIFWVVINMNRGIDNDIAASVNEVDLADDYDDNDDD